MHPVEPAAGCRCGEFVSKTTTDKSGPCYQHAIEKKIIPRAALNSITLPESAGAFIPPTHGSPPRREPTPTSAALKPSPLGPLGRKEKPSSGERREETTELCTHPASPQPHGHARRPKCPCSRAQHPHSHPQCPHRLGTGLGPTCKGEAARWGGELSAKVTDMHDALK